MADAWRPEQYDRFRNQRSAPFYDLLALVDHVGVRRAVDLGCGTGRLTSELHHTVGAERTVGIDSSPTMLGETRAVEAPPWLRFEAGDIGTFPDPDPTGEHRGLDLVFSNAALQWVPDHPAVLARWTEALAPHGQLAVQVPANSDHASHLVAAEVAHEQPFLDAFDGEPPPDAVHSVLRPEDYAEILHGLGYVTQHVRLQVYGHVLESTDAVVEWVRGTTLTRFAARLEPDLMEAFVARYRHRLREVLGDRSPYFYAFKRILFHARR